MAQLLSSRESRMREYIFSFLKSTVEEFVKGQQMKSLELKNMKYIRCFELERK